MELPIRRENTWVRRRPRCEAPGQRIDRAFLGQLAFRPNPFGVPGQRIGRAFLGQLAFGPSPFRALGLGRQVRGTGPGPMVPTGKGGGGGRRMLMVTPLLADAYGDAIMSKVAEK